MEVILQQIANISILIYIVSTMLYMGLSFFPKQFIVPLKNKQLIIKSLTANFILMPIITYIILQLIPLQPGLAIGLVLMTLGAGSPFMLKLVQFIKADMAFAVGLMLILSVVTLIYLPIMLSFILPDISVNSSSITTSLLVLILLPLAGGTALKWRYNNLAEKINPVFNQISNIFIILVVILYLGLNYKDFLAVFGTGAIIAALTFVLSGFLIGYFLGGPSQNTKTVLGMGTAIRNSSAAFVVALANFSAKYDVMAMIIVIYLLSIITIMLISAAIAKKTEKASTNA